MPEYENPDHWDTAARQYEQTAHPFTARFAEAALARVLCARKGMAIGSNGVQLLGGVAGGAEALLARWMQWLCDAETYSPPMTSRTMVGIV